MNSQSQFEQVVFFIKLLFIVEGGDHGLFIVQATIDMPAGLFGRDQEVKLDEHFPYIRSHFPCSEIRAGNDHLLDGPVFRTFSHDVFIEDVVVFVV